MEFIAKQNVHLDKTTLDELFATVFSCGPSYFYILNFIDLTISHISPLLKDIHGLDPETATLQDILGKIHPDDVEYVAKAEKKGWDLLHNKIGTIRNMKYKLSYCFRIKVADGSYQLFNQQTIVLATDGSGNVTKSLNIHTNLSHITTVNNYTLSVIGMFGEPSYLNISVLDEGALPSATPPLFTDREREIIRLLSEGWSSKQIAGRLFLSTETVNTHRKNILGKSKCKNVGHLVTKCITDGLI